MGVSWILLASFLMGTFGSFTSVYTTVMAYIASNTDKETRTERVGLAVGMSLAAATVGPFLSGAIAEEVSHLAVFVATFTCHAAAVVYVVIRIPNDGSVKVIRSSIIGLGR
jgi:MFS family permease